MKFATGSDTPNYKFLRNWISSSRCWADALQPEPFLATAPRVWRINSIIFATEKYHPHIRNSIHFPGSEVIPLLAKNYKRPPEPNSLNGVFYAMIAIRMLCFFLRPKWPFDCSLLGPFVPFCSVTRSCPCPHHRNLLFLITKNDVIVSLLVVITSLFGIIIPLGAGVITLVI